MDSDRYGVQGTWGVSRGRIGFQKFIHLQQPGVIKKHRATVTHYHKYFANYCCWPSLDQCCCPSFGSGSSPKVNGICGSKNVSGSSVCHRASSLGIV